MAARIRAFPNSPESVRKAKDKHFRALIAEASSERKVKKKDIASAAIMTAQSLRNKLERPETLTLGELRRIAGFLGWTSEELEKII